MAEGVQNAAIVCCFMTPDYQESHNCRKELQYADKLRVRIIPCMLSDKNGRKWTPSDWLGVISAGLNYISMRDQSESNIQSKADELIDRIRNHHSVQADASGSERDNFADLIRHEYLQNSYIHRIINEEKCFPIEQSYINLSMVQNEDQREKEKKLSQAEHKDAIIGTFEEIYGTKTVIDVKDIFEKCKDGMKKVLVLGRAGIGKSTFCQYATYQWAKGEIWTPYQLVISIKLRMLTDRRYPASRDRDYSPFDLVKKEYASRIIIPEEDRLRFEEQCKNGQVLWLLDGYDEFVQNIPEQLKDVFDLIRNTYHHILTSRPYSITLSYDVKMEITGFTDDNIAKYIQQFFAQITDQLEDASSEGHKLERFLGSNPNIWGIAHIPVNLELICSLWGDTDGSRKTILTMTELYDNITEWLLRLYLLKNKNLPQKDIDKMFKTDIYQYCQKDLMFLETLAFNAMKSSTLILQPSSLEQAMKAAKVTAQEKDNIFNIGVLKPFGGKPTGNQSQAKQEYYFVHLSFQEYFAARYLVNDLGNSTDANSVKFIRHNKYNQRFTLVFVFASGLLAGKDLSVLRNAFWDALFAEPVDLVGFRHMQILISCLEELSDKSDISYYTVIIEIVSKWINYVVSQESGTLFEQLQDSLKRSITLSREPIIRDQLIHLFERSDSRTKQSICVLISALSTYHVDPERLLLLTSAIEDGDEDVRRCACQALDAMGGEAATSETLSKLVSAALNDENHDVRSGACDALSAMGEKAATSEVFSELVDAFIDEDEDVRQHACDVLHKMGEKAATSEVISKLVSALDHENKEVRCRACNVLGDMGERAATSEVISKLVNALNDEDGFVRSQACDVLREMDEEAATSEVISKLVSALDHKNEQIRSSACDVLRRMGEKAATSEVISKLVSALDDENEEVRRSACGALGQMGEKAATSEVISKLVNALNDEDMFVRSFAWDALGKMDEKAATSEVISKLANALNDESGFVRSSACDVLGKMGEKAATSEVISKLVSAALNDEDGFVRSQACDVLGKMGEIAATSEVISKLVSAALNDEDGFVRRRACDVLRKMGEKAATGEAISKLVSALDHKNEEVRTRACDALAEMGEKAATSEVISKLASVLNDENEKVRSSVWGALGRMGEKAATSEKAAKSEVISKLLSVLDTSDEYMREAVNHFLKKTLISVSVLMGLDSDTVDKFGSCIDRSLLDDLVVIPAEAWIKVYFHATCSSWLSIATRVIFLQGVAITITDDTIMVYGSKEPIHMCQSNQQLVDKLVEAVSNQAERFDLPCVRSTSTHASAHQKEKRVLPSKQVSVVDLNQNGHVRSEFVFYLCIFFCSFLLTAVWLFI